LLLDVVELDQRNELAWLWLSAMTDNLDDRRICLENVIAVNPGNTLARERLAALQADASPTAVNKPLALRLLPSTTLWPVAAFWTSTSIFFIAGGVASLFQFMGILLRARGLVQNLSPIQIAWLPMALFFILSGLTGLGLAWQLAHRRVEGYYGSLLFGLMLTLLGPSAGLILEPPDYLAIVCTSLMPATAVLLTLASMASFESRANYHDRSVA
jgi:hypothetical protein